MKSLFRFPTGKDWKFLYYAIVIAMLIVALILELSPLLAPPPAGQEIAREMDALSARLTPLTADQTMAQAADADGRPMLLFVYASWCGPCRKIMPDVVDLVRERQMPALFLSRDTRMMKLSEYLVRGDYQDEFVPYVINPRELRLLQESVKRKGGRFDGSIPYMGVFDGKGRLIEELRSDTDRNALAAALDRAECNTR